MDARYFFSVWTCRLKPEKPTLPALFLVRKYIRTRIYDINTNVGANRTRYTRVPCLLHEHT